MQDILLKISVLKEDYQKRLSKFLSSPVYFNGKDYIDVLPDQKCVFWVIPKTTSAN